MTDVANRITVELMRVQIAALDARLDAALERARTISREVPAWTD